MKFDEMKTIADKGSIVTKCRDNASIVRVEWTVNGLPVKAQFDDHNVGLYSIEIEGVNALAFFKGYRLGCEQQRIVNRALAGTNADGTLDEVGVDDDGISY